MKFFTDYKEARNFAQSNANDLNLDHGIEKTSEFGKKGYNVKLLPTKENCHGHELFMERINAGDPLTN